MGTNGANDEIVKEQEFLRLLQEVRKEAKSRGGRISRGEIRELFGSFSLDEGQFAQVEAYLQANKVIIGAGTGDPDALPEGERDFLYAYLESIEGIEKLPDSVLDAVKLSAMAGEPSAQRQLAEQMLGSVVDIARLYAGQGVAIEDLIGTGNEALTQGVALLGHLEHPQEVAGELGRRIMDAMEDQISAMLDDHALGTQMEDVANLVADKAAELSRMLGRKVSIEELLAEGGVTREQIAQAERLTGRRIEEIDWGAVG